MRVTNSMMTNRMMLNINKNMTSIDKLYNQYASGKKISRPSDDPILASRALKFRTSVTETQQYRRNADQAMSWMNVTEAGFKNSYSILEKIRELCVGGSSDVPLTSSDRQELIAQIEQLVKQIGSEMNVTYSGRYVFSGYRTDQPYTLTSDQPNASYSIFQTFESKDIQYTKSYRKLDPTGVPEVHDVAILKLAYTDMGSVSIPGYKVNTISYYSETADPYLVADGEINYIPETGELVIGKDLAAAFTTLTSQSPVLEAPKAPNPADATKYDQTKMDTDFLDDWAIYKDLLTNHLTNYETQLAAYQAASDAYEAAYASATKQYEAALKEYHAMYAEWEAPYTQYDNDKANYTAWQQYDKDLANYTAWQQYDKDFANYTAWQQYDKDFANYTAWQQWEAAGSIVGDEPTDSADRVTALPKEPTDPADRVITLPTEPTVTADRVATLPKTPTTGSRPTSTTAPVEPNATAKPVGPPVEPNMERPIPPIAPVPPDPNNESIDYSSYASDFATYQADYNRYLVDFANYQTAYATYTSGYSNYLTQYKAYKDDVLANGAAATSSNPTVPTLTATVTKSDSTAIKDGPPLSGIAYGTSNPNFSIDPKFIIDYNTYLSALAAFQQNVDNYDSLRDQYTAFEKTNGNAFCVQYNKNGLKNGELNPLVTFNCMDYNNSNKIYTMDNQSLEYIVGANTTIQVNSLGKDVLTDKLYADLTNFCQFVSSITFSTEDELIAKYTAEGLSGDALTKAVKEQQDLEEQKARSALQDRFSDMMDLLDRHMNQVSTQQSNLGARMNRLDLISERLEEDEASYEELLSKTEDANIVEVIMNLQIAQSVYQASLQAGAKIIQMSLADYI